MSVLILLLSGLSSCSVLTPSYDVPPRTIEKDSCEKVVRLCNEYDPQEEYSSVELRLYIDDCQDAITCMFLREQACEGYVEVLIEALKKSQ